MFVRKNGMEVALPDLADKIAARLLDEWSIGSASRFMDGPPDWDSAGADEIAAVIREVMAAEKAK